MPQYHMGVDPSTWPRPDDVDVIAAREAWEATDDYEAAVRDWMANDDAVYEYAADQFDMTDASDREFERWLEGRAA